MKTLCRLLIALMIWTPYQAATAGVIGTDRAISTAAAGDRGTVLAFVSRADVADQLAALGIDRATALERVAAMNDDEVRSVAGRIGSLPAGADAGGIAILIIIIIGIWWFWRR